MGNPSQKPLYSTGSFTGYHFASPFQIESGYLSAESSRGHSLCANKEGWGPLSPHRYDFTPCFMDVWVAGVAAFGILGGAIAVWWLARRKHKFVIAKDWHFWTKQVWIHLPLMA